MMRIPLRRLFRSTGGIYQPLRRNCLNTLSQIRDELQKFPGGSVDLIKDNETGIATVIVNNPEKKNAFTGKMMVDLDKCVTDLESWNEGKGVIVAGSGSTFCSGGDLDTVKQILKSGDDMCKFMHDVTTRLYNLPLVSVAVVNGYALGGGAELTTACDFRVVTRSAKIGFIQVYFNIAPGWGGATRLVQILGRTKALQLLSSGKMVNSELAHEIGLVDYVLHSDDRVLEEGKKWLLEHCKGDVTSTRVIKQMVMAGEHLDTYTSLDEERRLFVTVWGNKSHLEAVNSKPKHK